MTHTILVLTSFVSLISIYMAYRESEKIRLNYEITLLSKNRRSLGVAIINLILGFVYYAAYDNAVSGLLAALYGQFIYWTVFDSALNVFREKSIIYMPPKDNEHNSIYDKAFLWLPHPGIAQLIFKITVLVILLILILI